MSDLDFRVNEVVRRTWGYESLRPLQAEAIRAGLSKRDSLVVLPTGGGKSLCFQVPPLVTGRLSVVVSPLIALMKDQVDGLRLNGYPAAAMHSNMSPAEIEAAEAEAANGSLRLLYVAPERLLTARFLALASRLGIDSVAIDEAHCISQWGHDFRPEYRRLVELRRKLPGASLHAFTATATPRVRDDIVEQLELRDPLVLVGRFDRPNLSYRVEPRGRLDVQLPGLIRPRSGRGSAVIVYGLSRNDADTTAGMLVAQGISAAAYHAGLTPERRRKVQDAFITERVNVVCATVAFGMGIDRSNVRAVIHTCMPKSIEAYQQETGRAGRDGLDAECVLLYSPGDGTRWRKLLTRGAEESEIPDDEAANAQESALRVQFELLDQMTQFCEGVRCRHRALSEYFGQEYETPSCGACDVCLGGFAPLPDGPEIARKIISCVFRVQQHSSNSFGAAYLTEVLLGARTEKVRQRGHDTLSTYGQLRGMRKDLVSSCIGQLVDQGVLQRVPGEYPVIDLGPNARAALKLETPVTLVDPARKPGDAEGGEGSGSRSSGSSIPADPMGEELFEELRVLRRKLADDRNVPPYVVFSDATLREMAAVRPGSTESLLNVRGVGQRKAAEFGDEFLGVIAFFCLKRSLKHDAPRPEGDPGTARPARRASASDIAAGALFAQGASVERVMAELGRAHSTVTGYLRRYIQEHKPDTIDPWVDRATADVIVETARKLGTGSWMPIRDALGERAPVDAIFFVLDHLRSRGIDPTAGRPFPGDSPPTPPTPEPEQ